MLTVTHLFIFLLCLFEVLQLLIKTPAFPKPPAVSGQFSAIFNYVSTTFRNSSPKGATQHRRGRSFVSSSSTGPRITPLHPAPVDHIPAAFVSLTAPVMQRLQLPDNTERMMCHFHKLHSPHLMGPMFMQQSLQILTEGALTLCLPATHRDPAHLSRRISQRHPPSTLLRKIMYDNLTSKQINISHINVFSLVINVGHRRKILFIYLFFCSVLAKRGFVNSEAFGARCVTLT